MNEITWKYVKTLKDDNAVEKFLRENNINLPEKLVKCLRENNGGRPSEFLFDTTRGKEYVFQSLFSYNKEDNNSIYRIYENIFRNSMMYPIGIEASGNIVCFHQKRNIYTLWNHETNKYEDILFE